MDKWDGAETNNLHSTTTTAETVIKKIVLNRRTCLRHRRHLTNLTRPVSHLRSFPICASSLTVRETATCFLTMSWIWSAAPPSDEASEEVSTGPSLSDTSTPTIDPYSSTVDSYSTTSDFGAAFGDDILTNSSSSPSPSFDPTGSSFDASSFDMPTYGATSSSSTPDFNAMRGISPSVLSATRSPSLDYVFSDDYKTFRKKSSTEQLTYLAGSAYLLGALVGGSHGALTAMRESRGKVAKLRLNAVLNGVGKRGALLANAGGVLALAFSLAESAVYNWRSDEDVWNYALAGAVAGGVFKSTAGKKVAGVWMLGGAVMGVAGIWASREGKFGKGLQGIL